MPEDRRELLHLQLERIVVDFKAGGLSIEFHEFRPPAVAPPEAAPSAQEVAS